MAAKEIYVGTSGWSYAHWKKNFYPLGLKATLWLKFYSDTFSTVEINNTFYHTPALKSVKNWQSQVPDDFLFAVKASRYITHMKRLKDCKQSVQLLFNRLKPFQSKLGPILFQLPPSFAMDKERLMDFIQYLDQKQRYVFEFRHSTWYRDEIYELLSKHKIALCITDLNKKLSPEVLTTNFAYIRLHGPKKAYQGTYGPKALQAWKKRILGWSKTASVFCYFDNDEKGYAIQDAKTLQGLIKKYSS